MIITQVKLQAIKDAETVRDICVSFSLSLSPPFSDRLPLVIKWRNLTDRTSHAAEG